MVSLHGLIQRRNRVKEEPLLSTVSENKRHDIKALFSRFPKNSHTAWFDPQTKKLAPHCISKQNCLVAYQRMVRCPVFMYYISKSTRTKIVSFEF